MIQWLKCRFLPWHSHTWTGRKSATGYVWEARCCCGSLWAIMMDGANAWTALPGNEFEAAIGYAPPKTGEGE